MTGDGDRDIRHLVHELGTQPRRASAEEVARLRRHFGEYVLPRRVSSYVVRKHQTHVEDNGEWPRDVTAEEYLESLRQAVRDPQSELFLEYSEDEDDWTLYVLGRARRASYGPASSGWIVVIFNADRDLWVTGFQPERGRDYVDERDGFWL